MQIILGLVTFLFSSVYVLFLDHIAFSSHALQKSLVVVIVVLLLVLYRFTSHTWKEFNTWYGKVFLIFWGTVLVQLLILSTGGLQSPFLVLIHFFMICISFVFSFSLALFFLLSCLIVIYIDVSFSHNFLMTILQDPSLTLLQFASLLAIIPVAYIISKQYHMKDALTGILRNQIKTTEAILGSLPEIIIVTDTNLKILSTNDAAVRMLQRSRSELLDKPLFDILFLRDKNNKLVTAKTFFPDGDTTKQPYPIPNELTLMKSPLLQRAVRVQIQTVSSTTKDLRQISFILGFTHTDETTSPTLLDKARAKYEALVENIKQKLSLQKMTDIKTDMLLLEKIENDTYTVQSLKDILRSDTLAGIDIAQLCKQTVLANKEFANQLHVRTNFLLPNFGQKDIAPLTVQSYPVKPEQLTGPFFTVACDVKQLELVVTKLFDMSILLASTQTDPHVNVSVERQNSESIIIKITGTCPASLKEKLSELFVPYYGSLSETTNLSIGSGLEGFLTKTISDNLKIIRKTTYLTTPASGIEFSLIIKKHSQKKKNL